MPLLTIIVSTAVALMAQVPPHRGLGSGVVFHSRSADVTSFQAFVVALVVGASFLVKRRQLAANAFNRRSVGLVGLATLFSLVNRGFAWRLGIPVSHVLLVEFMWTRPTFENFGREVRGGEDDYRPVSEISDELPLCVVDRS